MVVELGPVLELVVEPELGGLMFGVMVESVPMLE